MNFWVYLALVVVSYYIQAALAPKPRAPKPAALEDFEFPQAEEGTPQAVIFGDCWTESWMVLSVGNFRTDKIKKSTGKK
jgi:hypothetical protein